MNKCVANYANFSVFILEQTGEAAAAAASDNQAVEEEGKKKSLCHPGGCSRDSYICRRHGREGHAILGQAGLTRLNERVGGTISPPIHLSSSPFHLSTNRCHVFGS